MSEWTFITNIISSGQSVSSANTWEDWDISSIVPSGTKSVIVKLQFVGGVSGDIGARANGSTDDDYIFTGVDTFHYKFISVDSNRIIEIKASNTASDFFIVAYSSNDKIFVNKSSSIAVSSANVYESKDLSAIVPSGDIAAIHGIDSVSVNYNWRRDSSTDETDQYKLSSNSTFSHAITGVDSSRAAEFKCASTAANSYIYGSLGSDEFTVLDDPVELTVGSTATWVDIDLSGYSNITGVAINLCETAAAATEGAIREKGSTDDYPGTTGHDVRANGKVMAFCGVDSSGYIQAYKEFNGLKFYLIGYFTKVIGSTLVPINPITRRSRFFRGAS